jgi:hydroxymethylpyrimidine kinase/phosphomethylpyrimidine kinase
VLSIAGTDPTGGAGIQADLKAIAANGGYGMAVVTALVAQNTQGVRAVHLPPVEFLNQQLDAVSDDVQIDAVKIGMLATAEVIDAVRTWLERVRPPVVVLDPVMVATSGDRLLDKTAEAALLSLAALAQVVTPNVPELAILAGERVARDWDTVLEQARRVAERHGIAVLAKGGHLAGDRVPDALVDASGVRELPGVRIATANTHGTGCSLSAALATRRAAGMGWPEALAESKRWLTESIRHGADLDVGVGNGPISHLAGLWERGGTTTRPTPAEVTVEWWEHIRDLREAIDELPFVRGLADGTLSRDAFLWYLRQDALYLRDYSRACADASRLAPTSEEQVFWAHSAHAAITAEMDLHESWLDPELVQETRPSRTTTAYLNHLAAAGSRGDYPVLIAALLPCFWLYQDVAGRLHPLSHPAHPYRSWLDLFADEAFAVATARARDLVSRAAASADQHNRQRMRDAFRDSARHELAFFRAPSCQESPRDLSGAPSSGLRARSFEAVT